MARISRKAPDSDRSGRDDIRMRRVEVPRNGIRVDKEKETREAAARLLKGLSMSDVPVEGEDIEMDPDEQARMEFRARAGSRRLVGPQGQEIRATAEPQRTRVVEPENNVTLSPLVSIIDNARNEFAQIGYQDPEVVELTKAYAVLEAGNAIASLQPFLERFVVAVEVLAGIRVVQK